MYSLTTLSNLFNTYTQNTSATNTALGKQLINAAHRYLLQKFFNNEFSSTALTVQGQQYYNVPANYSKMKDVTVTVGQLKYTLTEVFTREEWDKVNAMPYTSSIPVYFFVYNNTQTGIWPIPSDGSTSIPYMALSGTFTVGDTVTSGGVTGTILTITTTTATTGTLVIAVPASSYGGTAFPSSGTITDSTSGATATISSATVTSGDTITYNYKIRVPDLTFADYTTGSVTMTSGSPTVTGSGSSWLTNYITSTGSTVNLNLYLQPTAPKGDNNWYQVSSIASDTSLTLANIYPTTQTTQSAVSYTIGQMPLLLEDFQDLLVYWALIRYFSTIQKDMEKASQFEGMYKEGEERLALYCGTKSVNVNLGRRINLLNPNLFGSSFGANP